MWLLSFIEFIGNYFDVEYSYWKYDEEDKKVFY